MYGRPQAGVKPRKRWRWTGTTRLQRRLVALVVGMALVVFGLVQAFAVHTVVVQPVAAAGSIKTVAQTLVSSSVLSDNLLTLNSGGLSAKLQQADPALRGVAIRRQWPHTLVILVTLQQPSLGWSSDGQQYLLDSDGSVIGPLQSGSPLPVITDASNLPVATGKQVVSARFVAFVQALVPALSSDGYGVRGMSIQDTTYDLTVQTNKGYNLIFDTTRDVSSEMADLKSVQTVLTTQKQTPASYIDLRIAGKAYYK
jgi:cell division septal protein FtsQ